jgi:hypothetical protein
MNILTFLSFAITAVSAFCSGKREINLKFVSLEPETISGANLKAFCVGVEFSNSENFTMQPMEIPGDKIYNAKLDQPCENIQEVTVRRNKECRFDGIITTKIDGTERYDASTNTLEVFAFNKDKVVRPSQNKCNGPTPYHGDQECIVS